MGIRSFLWVVLWLGVVPLLSWELFPHHQDVALAVTDPVLVPVDEVDVPHRAGLHGAVLDGEGLAGPEEGAPDMGVAVEDGGGVRGYLGSFMLIRKATCLGPG